MNERMAYREPSEAATAAELLRLGYQVAPYGQEMLTPAAREMLRGVPTPERWVPDFIVSKASNPVLVDAKFSFGTTQNISIELRSLIAAQSWGMDTYYVCSVLDGRPGTFRDFGVIFHRQVDRNLRFSPQLSRACCASCLRILLTDPDPMRALPDYCPNQPKGSTQSGTPYAVIPHKQLSPLSEFVFRSGLDGSFTPGWDWNRPVEYADSVT